MNTSIPFTVVSGFDQVDCLIDVTSYCGAQGNRRTWDSPDDYYGWEEIEFNINDLEGKPWPELRRDLTKAEVLDAEQRVRDYYRELNSDY